MAREVRKEEAKRFIKKAIEFYYSALEDYQKRRFNAASFDSAQAIILANDAFCISVLGRRASKDHQEAIQLHNQAAMSKESRKEILGEALDKRNEFGYTEYSSTEKDANLLLVRAKRFIDWVKTRI
jgi:HEPN domain-containing protein